MAQASHPVRTAAENDWAEITARILLETEAVLFQPDNPFTFTSWLAGAGIKGGTTYGESDEWSYKAVKNPIYCYDQHATILHLLGIDHEKLTFRHNGIDRRLTDVHGHVLAEILA